MNQVPSCAWNRLTTWFGRGLLVASVLGACGCATYEAMPLDPQEILADLERLSLDVLTPTRGPDAPTPVLDAADGVTIDEAVVAALLLNPDLRALRSEHGVAEGEIISASLVANPRLDLSWMHIEHFTHSLGTSASALGVTWTPPRPGELDAQQSRANARLEELRARTAGEELRVASEARKAYLAAYATEEQLRLMRASLDLQARIGKLLRDKRDLGDASSLDVSLVDLVHAETMREQALLAGERDRARLDLNRVLGLPPTYDLKLQLDRDLFRPEPITVAPAALHAMMLTHRPDLKAASWEYEQSEQGLRLACIQSWPWFEIGPAYARDELDGRGANRWGFSLGIDLPIANRNHGEIARLRAKREQLRESFIARVHEARAQVAGAYQRLRIQERLLLIYAETAKPIIDAYQRLSELGFESGELDVTQLITIQDRALRSRREFLADQLAYGQAVVDLERCVGCQLSPAVP